FGLVRAAAPPLSGAPRSEAPLTKAHPPIGNFMGTLQYMAPEQFADSGSADARSDVYSLGIIFYEMLTGFNFFDYRDPKRQVQVEESVIFRRMVSELPPAPREKNPATPKELSDLVMEMLDKVPANRPTLAKIAKLLRRLPTSLPDPAPPEPPKTPIPAA